MLCKRTIEPTLPTNSCCSHEKTPHSSAELVYHERRDYRWDDWPGDADQVVHPHDISMMNYRGHSVMQTLIRAYFSPADTTGQRFIYAGSADGAVHVWGETLLLWRLPFVHLLC